MTHAPAQAKQRLLVFGEFFLDLVFYDLPQVPKMGEEVKTSRFATFPGGGVATTAMVARELGTPTSVITRVGEDARMNPAWQKLVQSGVSIEACSFDKHLPTALTVCASYDRDRMMITQDAINRNLDKLLAMPGAKKQLRRAKHLHLACALWPLSSWKLTIGRLKGSGLALSADLGWNPQLWQSQHWLPLLKHFDFVFPNEQEARAMTQERSVEKAEQGWWRCEDCRTHSMADSCMRIYRDGRLRIAYAPETFVERWPQQALGDLVRSHRAGS